jgi:prohibitin 2
MDSQLRPHLPFILGGLLVAFLVFNMVFIINPGERGVVITLGSISESVKREGLNFKIPLIQTVHIVSIKQQTTEGSASSFSSDLQTMAINFKVIYQIPESSLVNNFKDYQGDVYLQFVEPRIQEALKTVAAKYTAENFVKSRDEVKTKVLAELKDDLNNVVLVHDLPLTNVDLSDELEKAIEQKQVKEQEALAKKYELDKAQKDAQITIVKAEAEAKSMMITGDALRATPQLAALKAIEKWNGVGPVVSGGGGNMFDVSRLVNKQ